MGTIPKLSDSKDYFCFSDKFYRYQIFKIRFCAHQLVESSGFDDRSALHEDDPITLAQKLEKNTNTVISFRSKN